MASSEHTVKSKNKNALVVDDSKLARYVLKEMLLDKNIKVETAESAEEALGLLSSYKPDIIFMDHMMPGMDGFKAVQAIKNDPETAMIPIVMYTSKDGAVYVSQARALGAVGVIPKKLKPVQLEKVLVQLNLIPEPSETVTPIKPVVPEKPAIEATKHSLEEIALSASEELEKDSMRHLFRQLFNEQRDCIKQDQFDLTEAMVAKVAPIIKESQRKKPFLRLFTAAAGVAIVFTAIWSITQNTQQNQTLNAQLTEQLSKQESLLRTLNEKLNTLGQVATSQTPLTDKNVFNASTFEWALNLNTQIPYQQPLNNQKNYDYINQLMQQLQSNNFDGFLSVKYHSGEFCESVSEQGHRALAAEDADISVCNKNSYDSQDTSQQAMEEFDHYLSIVNLYYPQIELEFEFMGPSYTLVDYPDAALVPNAGEWNRIAQLNNRFEYKLIPTDSSRQAALTLEKAPLRQTN